jgi:class 3 adenylate cyclase
MTPILPSTVTADQELIEARVAVLPVGSFEQHGPRAEAARLEEARLAALEERVEADLACGRHGQLVAELDALTRAHPLRERLWAQRMLALYRAGRQAEALRAYQELRGILGEELGLEPSAALARLEGAILRHEPELEWPPEGRAEPPAAPTAVPPEAPGGVVTFLFTDLVGSTELLERLGDDAAEELRRTYFALLRRAVSDTGGEEVKSLGDGLMVAFSSPLAALRCALAIQEAIAEHNRAHRTRACGCAWGSTPGSRPGTRTTSSAPPWWWPNGSATGRREARSWPASS